MTCLQLVCLSCGQSRVGEVVLSLGGGCVKEDDLDLLVISGAGGVLPLHVFVQSVGGADAGEEICQKPIKQKLEFSQAPLCDSSMKRV